MAAFKLAIDPGHGLSNIRPGLFDPGACAAGHREADIVLAWALTCKFILTGNGVPVYLTRESDHSPAPVSSRDDRAEAQGCTHFLSLHCNAGGLLATGTETFYRGSAEAKFAQAIQQIAVGAMGRRDRGIKTESATARGRLAVMAFGPPAALLEIGFITNAGDRKRMLDREVRIAFAEDLAAWCRKEMRR